MRRLKFQNDNYYHIYNRGVDKRDVFCDDYDFTRYLRLMRELNNESSYEERQYYRNLDSKKELSSEASELSSFLEAQPKVVKIVAYCLIKNHYHFLLKQLKDGGISGFMHRVGTGHTNYFNKKYKRSGTLFQGPYKAKEIKSHGYLLYLSSYINANIEIHGIEKAENYQWSSYPDYLGERRGSLCKFDVVMSDYDNPQDYKEHTNEIIKSSKEAKDEYKKIQLEDL